jgi:hypothetical protein
MQLSIEPLKTFYEAVGAPAHPKTWLIIVFILSGTIFTVLSWAIGKEYKADHAEHLKVIANESPSSHSQRVNSFAPPAPASPIPRRTMNANQAEQPWPIYTEANLTLSFTSNAIAVDLTAYGIFFVVKLLLLPFGEMTMITGCIYMFLFTSSAIFGAQLLSLSAVKLVIPDTRIDALVLLM